MKKVAAVLAVVVMVVSLSSLAFASEKVKIKSVDAKAGTIVYVEDGKDMTKQVDKSVELDKVKAGDTVRIDVENDMVTKMRKVSKAAVGC
jgi:hypothetical protein